MNKCLLSRDRKVGGKGLFLKIIYKVWASTFIFIYTEFTKLYFKIFIGSVKDFHSRTKL
jgi:hypothetical protein